ncbi:MAG: hypothetical protein KAT62_00560 [Desulfuromonadales bacterium]|nr:hypothetical protein [Desulfuromonadales bacterium]
MTSNYIKCPKCKRKYHIKAGPACPLCGTNPKSYKSVGSQIRKRLADFVKVKPVPSNRQKLAEDFNFPEFPYTEETIVKIKDRTKYKTEFLDDHYYGDYGPEDFKHDLAPCRLEIEVEEFPVMFKKRATALLGIDPLPVRFSEFQENIVWLETGENMDPPYIDDPCAKRLLKLGLVSEKKIEHIDENYREYFNRLLVPDLQKKCEKLGLKKSQNKQGLISSLMEEKNKISIPGIAKPNQEYHDLLNKLSEAYIADISKQLQDKPASYAATVWAVVACGCIELMPENGQKLVKEKKQGCRHFSN